jgi:hypothetical protein
VYSLKEPDEMNHVMSFENKPRRLALIKGKFLALTLDDVQEVYVLDIRGVPRVS